ncbi:L,D-transpeptidase [Sciscionella sediminilitoris]|uniref:L,D-transpeptidase n=1 Tax=Sciscionella sediminilitoris TaxID=1445613 RepID=UPI000AD0A8C6|nr:Ig-like domain-containing protein [Sciscionella sp. SE31]
MGVERTTRHVTRRGGRTHRRLLAIAFTATTAVALAACSGGQGGTDAGGKDEGQAPVPVAKQVQLKQEPSDGSKLINPTQPVKLSVQNGSLSDVALNSSSGAKVKGEPDAQNRTWTTTEPLGYGKTYTWSGNMVSSDGKQSPVKGSFSTIEPTSTINGKINVGDDQTYGIAMPIKIDFGRNLIPQSKRADVEKALKVETSNNTEGSWAWLDGASVHWRPKGYWEPGTKVKVSAKLYGLNMGNGKYGAGDVSSSFKIGSSQIVKGDTDTHRMQVFKDGKMIEDYPASYGLDSVLWRNTRSGTHVVMSKHSTYLMNNPRGGYENLPVKWAVRISNNGEFIHALPASTWAQGSTNVSHGCVNLSNTRAKQYYDFAQIGDPVEITGSNAKLGSADGDFYDWAIPWDQWQKKSAIGSGG